MADIPKIIIIAGPNGAGETTFARPYTFGLERQRVNKRPIDEARDPDIRLSGVALKRAAKRAHELAAHTGTAIVVVRDGIIQHVLPTTPEISAQMHEPPAPYIQSLKPPVGK